MIPLAPQSKLERPHAEAPERPREAAFEMEAKEAEEESKESSFIGLQEIKITMSKVIPKKAHRENCKSGFQHKPHQTNGIAIPKDQSSRKEKLRQPYGKPRPPNKTLKRYMQQCPDENTKILPKEKPNTEEPNKLDKET